MIQTLQLGKKITKAQLEKAGFKVGTYAAQILEKVTFKKQTVELVVKTVRELTGKDSATRSEIYEAALKQGLDLCPAEVGPALRLAYKDQPNGEWILVGMEPITDSGGDLDVFRVERDGDARWLDGDYGLPDIVWGADYRWVFVRRKGLRSGKSGSVDLDYLNLADRIKALEEWRERMAEWIGEADNTQT